MLERLELYYTNNNVKKKRKKAWPGEFGMGPRIKVSKRQDQAGSLRPISVRSVRACVRVYCVLPRQSSAKSEQACVADPKAKVMRKWQCVAPFVSMRKQRRRKEQLGKEARGINRSYARESVAVLRIDSQSPIFLDLLTQISWILGATYVVKVLLGVAPHCWPPTFSSP